MMHITKTVKRWLAMALACVMLFTLCPTAAFAQGIRTDIVVSNIQLSAGSVTLNGVADVQSVTITADLTTVPQGFTGDEHFRFNFQETVVEYQHRGSEEVKAQQDSNGDWHITCVVNVTSYWPQGLFVLENVEYGGEQVAFDNSQPIELQVNRPNMDNTDPAIVEIYYMVGGVRYNPSHGFQVDQDNANQLEIHMVLSEKMNNDGFLRLRTDDVNTNFYDLEYRSVYVESQDANGDPVHEYVTTVDVDRLYATQWYISHCTLDDASGNYVFYNYNGNQNDQDGAIDGDDDILDNTIINVTDQDQDPRGHFKLYFRDDFQLWNNITVTLYDGSNAVLQSSQMTSVSWNDIEQYVMVAPDIWDAVAQIEFSDGNNTTATTKDPLCDSLQVVNGVAYDIEWRAKDYNARERIVTIYRKDNEGNLLHDRDERVEGSGTLDLSDAGIQLDFNVPEYEFPGDAEALSGRKLQFVGWWVKETGQVITDTTNDVINSNAMELHIYPKYEAAPVRLQAHYVNTDGTQITYTKWFEASYTDTLADLKKDFVYPNDHIQTHQFEGWWNHLADAAVMTPDVEGEVFVAEYDELYFTLNYEYLVDVDINGQSRADWHHASVTVFVSNSNASYGDSDVYDYFRTEIANGLTHATGLTVQDWECMGWQPGDNDDISFGNCYGIRADYGMTRLYFLNTDQLWDTSNGLYFKLLDENGNVIDQNNMLPVPGSQNDICWYSWIPDTAWEKKYSVIVYAGQDDTAADYLEATQLPGDTDMAVLVVNDAPVSGEFEGANEWFDLGAWYMQGGDHGGDGSGHNIIVYMKDNGGNLNEWSNFHTGSAGKIDLSDEGLELPMDVEDFVFPGDAGQLKDKHLKFVGWWVKETDQLITDLGNGDQIDTGSYEIHIYPVYESAPVRLQAHYVNADGDQITYTEWFEADYTDTLAALKQNFTYPNDHIQAHQFEGWWNHLADTDVMSPDVEGTVFVAEYDELYFTLNYEYLVDVDINGQSRADWHHASVTVFVSNSNTPYGDNKVYNYFQTEIANGLTHATGLTVQDWECMGWQPGDSDDISFGNCYGIRADYGMTRLYFLNTDNLWNTEDGLFMEVLKADGIVAAGGELISVPGSQPGYCWYMWVDDSALEDKENLQFKVYNGSDKLAGSWTAPIALPGDADMVVLVVNGAPESGEFEAGNDRFDENNWYMQGGDHGSEGGEGEEEPAGEFHIMVGAAVEGGIELFVDFMTGGTEINVAEAIEEMAQEMLPELQAQVDKLLAVQMDGYTFPEEANNGCSNQKLQFVGWYVPATGEIFNTITEVKIHTENLEGQEILVVAKYDAVPMRLEAGYVNADGVFEVRTKWYSMPHGTPLDDVLMDFAGELDTLDHTQAHPFQDWNPVEEYQVRDDLVTPELCSLGFVAVYEKKYVTINYCYQADVEYEEDGSKTVKTEEVNGSVTIFVEDHFTDKDVADYFKENIAGTLAHTGGKVPVWNYDSWIPSPMVSGNANCYGIYATYPAVMDETKKQEAAEIIGNAAGETVDIDMCVIQTDEAGNETVETVTVIPSELLQAAKENNVDVVFDMGDYSWTVSGSSIQEGAADINLGLHTDTVLPDAAIEGLGNVSGEGICLSIAHDGDFGFDAKLTIPAGEPGLFASLYYYMEELGKLMFLHTMQVGEDGNIIFDFNHASEYLLVLSEEDLSQRVAWADLDGNGEENEEEVFSSLYEAVNAVNERGGDETVTVRMFRSFEENEPIVVTGKIILDLNDCTLSGTSGEKKGYSLITNKGELTICNGTVTYYYDGETGNWTFATNTITNSGLLTVENSSIINTTNVAGHCGYAVDNNSTAGNAVLYVCDGTEILSTGTGYDSIRQFANSEILDNEVTVQGGCVGSIWQQNPSDGSNGRNQKDTRASLVVTGGQVGAVYYEPSANASLCISGGTISSITAYDADAETDTGRIPAKFITGGTFGTAPDAGLLVDAFVMETCEDGTTRVMFNQPADFYQYSVILGQDFGIKIYMHIRDEVLCDENAYISFTIGDKEQRVPVSEWTLGKYQNVHYQTFTFHVAAADLDTEFSAQLFYTGGETRVITHSIGQYLEEQAADESSKAEENQDKELLQVYASTKTYGQYAKQYFKRPSGASAPVEDEVLKAQVTVDTLERFRKEGDQGDAQVKLDSVSLLLRSETVLRLFFSVCEDVNGFAVTLNGRELEIRERGGLYYVDIEGIVAQNLDKNVTVQLHYEGLEAPIDVTYCPMTYCYNVLKAGDQYEAALKNVVRALYLYNQSAVDYFS